MPEKFPFTPPKMDCERHGCSTHYLMRIIENIQVGNYLHNEKHWRQKKKIIENLHF